MTVRILPGQTVAKNKELIALLAFIEEHIASTVTASDERAIGWNMAMHNMRNKILELVAGAVPAESFGLDPEMQPVVDELRRRMAAGAVPAPQWQPIETAPTTGWILLASGPLVWVTSNTSQARASGARHWMPLPSPPRSEQDETQVKA